MPSTYAGLQSTIDSIIEEAIDWEMSDRNWHKKGNGYEIAGPYDWTVPGPGGSSAPVTFHEPRSGTDITYDFHGDVYEPITQAVQDLFQPFLDMPDPAEFGDTIAACIAGTEKLAAGEEINGTPVTPNGDLGAIQSASTDLAVMAGATIDAFRWRYLDRLPIVLRGQAGAACTLTEVVSGEAAIWANAQTSVASLADAMLTAMQERSPSSAAAALTVGGAVLSVAGALATGGLSIVLGIAGTAAGAGSAFVGDETRSALSGGSPMDVIASGQGVADELNDQICAEEELLVSKATTALSDLDDDQYDLSVPPELYSGTTEQDYTETGPMIAVQASRLNDVAGTHLPQIASTFRQSSQSFYGVDAYPAWSRQRLGLVYAGAYYEWKALQNKVIDFLLGNEKALYDAADQLIIAAGFLGDADAGVTEDLNEHAAAVEESNQPPPPAPALPHGVTAW